MSNDRFGRANVDYPPAKSATNYEIQPSRLLQSLFENIEPGQRLVVLNIGAALPETISFFANYRCKLFVTDLLAELLLTTDNPIDEIESQFARQEKIADILSLPAGVRLDIVFFWESLNYLGEENISALMQVLKPHLHENSKGHCFAVHKSETEEAKLIHGIHDAGHLSVRPHARVAPGYQPLPQGRLVTLLECFTLDRSVLMRDQQLELLLKVA